LLKKTIEKLKNLIQEIRSLINPINIRLISLQREIFTTRINGHTPNNLILEYRQIILDLMHNENILSLVDERAKLERQAIRYLRFNACISTAINLRETNVIPYTEDHPLTVNIRPVDQVLLPSERAWLDLNFTPSIQETYSTMDLVASTLDQIRFPLTLFPNCIGGRNMRAVENPNQKGFTFNNICFIPSFVKA